MNDSDNCQDKKKPEGLIILRYKFVALSSGLILISYVDI
jgi:hypothetical protein